MVSDALLMNTQSLMVPPLLPDYFTIHCFIMFDSVFVFAIKVPMSELISSSIDSL
jgi:hypothetical protein